MNDLMRNMLMGIIVLLLLLISVAIIMSFYQDSQNNENKQETQNSPTQPSIIMLNNPVPPPSPIHPINPINSVAHDIMTEFDLRSAYDPLVEATKRPPRHITLPMINNPHFNYPTRGFTDSYSLMGYLIAKENKENKDNKVKPEQLGQEHQHKLTQEDKENRIIKLFGRQKYPNSSEYEYYAIINTGFNDNIKYSLENQRRELYDGDHVYIDILKKNYRVKMLKNRIFEYNPYAL